MVNQWVQFVKEYARENNISYGCAISEAGQAYRKMKQGGNSKRERVEMDDMSMEDNDTPEKIISLPPLQSKREESLYGYKKDELSKILKGSNIQGINKMKKDDMIKKILELEGIEEGVKWGDKDWIYENLKKAHRCNDPMDTFSGLRAIKSRLKKAKKDLEDIKKIKATTNDEKMWKLRRMRGREYFINFLNESLNECNSLLSKDFEKEYRGSGNMKGINPWIEFVKDYSRKNAIKYNEALREIKRLGLYK